MWLMQDYCSWTTFITKETFLMTNYISKKQKNKFMKKTIFHRQIHIFHSKNRHVNEHVAFFHEKYGSHEKNHVQDMLHEKCNFQWKILFPSKIQICKKVWFSRQKCSSHIGIFIEIMKITWTNVSFPIKHKLSYKLTIFIQKNTHEQD